MKYSMQPCKARSRQLMVRRKIRSVKRTQDKPMIHILLQKVIGTKVLWYKTLRRHGMCQSCCVRYFLLHESLYHCLGIEVLQVRIRLPRAHEDNWLTSNVRHRNGRSDLGGRKRPCEEMYLKQMLHVSEDYLVVNGVKLGEHNAVNKMWIILS